MARPMSCRCSANGAETLARTLAGTVANARPRSAAPRRRSKPTPAADDRPESPAEAVAAVGIDGAEARSERFTAYGEPASTRGGWIGSEVGTTGPAGFAVCRGCFLSRGFLDCGFGDGVVAGGDVVAGGGDVAGGLEGGEGEGAGSGCGCAMAASVAPRVIATAIRTTQIFAVGPFPASAESSSLRSCGSRCKVPRRHLRNRRCGNRGRPRKAPTRLSCPG